MAARWRSNSRAGEASLPCWGMVSDHSPTASITLEDVIISSFALPSHLVQMDLHCVNGFQGGGDVLVQRHPDLLNELHTHVIPPARLNRIPAGLQRLDG